MTERLINDIRENGIESFIINEVMSIIREWDIQDSYRAIEYGDAYEELTSHDLARMEEILRNEPELTAKASNLREAAYAVYKQWCSE